jgi:hypothetical protein
MISLSNKLIFKHFLTVMLLNCQVSTNHECGTAVYDYIQSNSIFVKFQLFHVFSINVRSLNYVDHAVFFGNHLDKEFFFFLTRG